MFWLAVEDQDGKWRIMQRLPCDQTHTNPKTGQYHKIKFFPVPDRVKYFTRPKSIFIKSHKVVTAATWEEACQSL